jgi:hypothetical protein
MLKERFVLVLVILSALLISASAAFFSVYGLSKVFAGAGISVIIMASVLEGSKLIAAYALHQNKKVFPPLLRIYLSIAVIVLMIITSAGIYGFLSNAYQITANTNTIVEKEIGIVQAKVDNLSVRLEDLQTERESIVSDITELRNGLSTGTTISYIDKESGERITTTSSATRTSLERQLTDAIERRNKLDFSIEDLSTQIDSFKIEILTMETGNDAAAELGPIIYLSKITEVPMDILMNYFILMIIFVFDPLAITLVISISYLINDIASKKTSPKKIEVSPKLLGVYKSDNQVIEDEKIEEAYKSVVEKSPTRRKIKKTNTKKSNLTTSRTKRKPSTPKKPIRNRKPTNVTEEKKKTQQRTVKK